ncbi:asparaginyl-tRNA synthetase, variant 2 [Trifolium repens]|nr:asparaginyl-tRNA synthetase, variant 2 [Trifolium repens]
MDQAGWPKIIKNSFSSNFCLASNHLFATQLHPDTIQLYHWPQFHFTSFLFSIRQKKSSAQKSSAQPRVAAKYLQTLFDKEDLHGRQNLHLENILAGKTRKEASRMFFETLVLKTRDYVQVEQPKPFGNIILQPRTKLMKTDF